MTSVIEQLPNDNWTNEDVLSFYTLSVNEFSLDYDPQSDGNETETISELAYIVLKGIKNADDKTNPEFYNFLPTEITLNLSNWVYFKREEDDFKIDEFNSGEISFTTNGVEYDLYVEEVYCEELNDEINRVCDEAHIASQLELLNNNYNSEIEEFEQEYLDIQKKAQSAKNAAVSWLNRSPKILDTETTGLGQTAQIIEIAIFDKDDNEVFYSKLKPTVAIDKGAEMVHGISLESLADAPTWTDINYELEQCLANQSVIIFNKTFDVRLLQQTASAFNDPAPWLANLKTHCAMYLAADCYGSTNQYGSISLANATQAAGVEWRGQAHGAKADALATLDLVKAIANEKQQTNSVTV